MIEEEIPTEKHIAVAMTVTILCKDSKRRSLVSYRREE